MFFQLESWNDLFCSTLQQQDFCFLCNPQGRQPSLAAAEAGQVSWEPQSQLGTQSQGQEEVGVPERAHNNGSSRREGASIIGYTLD